MSSLEVINIAPYVHNEDGKEDVVSSILQSLSSRGFLYITGHNMEEQHIQTMMRTCTEFFHLTEDQKMLLSSKDRARRGYSPIGTENFASLAGEKKPNDLVEKIRFGPTIDADTDDAYYKTKESRIHFAPNEWGNQPQVFRDTITSYYAAMESLSLVLLEIIAVGLHMNPSYFTSCMDKHTSILSCNYYPPSTGRTDRLRIAEHTDVSMITIVSQSEGSVGGGLEICDREGNWSAVPYIPGALVVNIGDCLCDWSGGRLMSTRHRVSFPPHPTESSSVSSQCSERTSVAYFVSPNYDALMCTSHNDGTSGSSMSYSKWRQKRIQKAMKALK